LGLYKRNSICKLIDRVYAILRAFWRFWRKWTNLSNIKKYL